MTFVTSESSGKRLPLIALVAADAVILAAAFGRVFLVHNPASIYLLLAPLLVANYIIFREFISPKLLVDEPGAIARGWPLPWMSRFLLFVIVIPRLYRFLQSMNWKPLICFSFSLVICLVIISVYAGAKVSSRQQATKSTPSTK